MRNTIQILVLLLLFFKAYSQNKIPNDTIVYYKNSQSVKEVDSWDIKLEQKYSEDKETIKMENILITNTILKDRILISFKSFSNSANAINL